MQPQTLWQEFQLLAAVVLRASKRETTADQRARRARFVHARAVNLARLWGEERAAVVGVAFDQFIRSAA